MATCSAIDCSLLMLFTPRNPIKPFSTQPPFDIEGNPPKSHLEVDCCRDVPHRLGVVLKNIFGLHTTRSPVEELFDFVHTLFTHLFWQKVFLCNRNWQNCPDLEQQLSLFGFFFKEIQSRSHLNGTEPTQIDEGCEVQLFGRPTGDQQ